MKERFEPNNLAKEINELQIKRDGLNKQRLLSPIYKTHNENLDTNIQLITEKINLLSQIKKLVDNETPKKTSESKYESSDPNIQNINAIIDILEKIEVLEAKIPGIQKEHFAALSRYNEIDFKLKRGKLSASEEAEINP